MILVLDNRDSFVYNLARYVRERGAEAVVRGGRVYFSAGGGIVADSDPEQEYRETLDKARGLIEALDSRA